MRNLTILLFTVLLISCGNQKSAEEYIKKGMEYSGSSSWKSAVIEFKNAVKADPENSQARALLGKAYVEVSNFPGAIKELERAQKLGYDFNQLILPLANAYLASGEHKKIINEIRIPYDITHGTEARLHAIRALAYLRTYQEGKALDSLKKASAIDESIDQVRLAWGRFEQNKRNFKAQRAWIEPLLDEKAGVVDAWSQLGDIEIASNNFAAAETAYSRAIELRKFTSPDVARRALARIELKKLDQAQEDINKLKSVGMVGPIVLHADGVIAYQQERIAEAKTKFQEILAKQSEYLPSRYLLALIYFTEKDYENALSHLKIYTSKNTANKSVNYLLASTLLQLKKSDEVIELVDELMRDDPKDVRAYTLKGNALLQQDKRQQAIKTFEDGLHAAPNNADLHYRLGLLLSQNDKSLLQGQRYLVRAKELSANASPVDMALYLNLIRQKQFNAARNLANEMAKQEGQQTQGQNLIGLSYLAEGNVDKAISELERILKENSSDSNTVQNLVSILVKNNRMGEAKQVLSEAVKANPANMDFLNQLALISNNEGNNEESLQWLKQSMEQNPDALSPKLQLALQYLKNSDATRAVQVLNGVAAADKETPHYMLLMSLAKLAVNEHQHSLRLLKTLVNSEPELVDGHFLLSLAYSRENDLKRSRISLERTLQLAPKHFLANLHLTRLNYFEGKFDAFSSQLKQLSKLDKDHADVKLLQAKQATLNKDYKAAITILTKLKKSIPHSEIYFDLAINQKVDGQTIAAIKTLEEWNREQKPNARLSFLQGQLYLEGAKYEQARSAFLQAEEFMPDNIILLNNLAWLFQDIDPVKGLEYAQRALQIQPENPMVMDTVATLYLATEQPDKALDLANSASKALPYNVEVQINYARVLKANDLAGRGKAILVELKSRTDSSRDKQLIDQELKNM